MSAFWQQFLSNDIEFQRLSILTGSDVDTVALGISEGQDLEVGVAFGNLLEPFVAGPARPQRIQIAGVRAAQDHRTLGAGRRGPGFRKEGNGPYRGCGRNVAERFRGAGTRVWSGWR